MAGPAMTKRDGANIGRWRLAGWGAAAGLLLLLLIAMRFTDDLVWGTEDFTAAALLLLAAGLALELAVKPPRRRPVRIAAGAHVLPAFLLVWAELAVGIFD